jgi:putative inorganic carbon (HCO3(-)) transporter
VIGPERLQQLWSDPAQETVVGRLNSIGFRQEVWQWAIEAIGDFPFTGTGLGTFRRVVQRFYPLDVPITYDISHAHNIFEQVALDVGLPGLVAYIAILLVAGVIGWQVARRDERLRPLAIGLTTGLITLHIYGLTDALALGSKTNLLFWLILGNLAAMKRVSEITSRNPNSVHDYRQDLTDEGSPNTDTREAEPLQ